MADGGGSEGTSEFDRGREAQAVLSRLADHDAHFQAISGQVASLTDEVHKVVLALQKLADTEEAREATILATASALAESEKKRREVAEQRWSKYQKAFAVIATLAAMVTIGVSLFAAFHK